MIRLHFPLGALLSSVLFAVFILSAGMADAHTHKQAEPPAAYTFDLTPIRSYDSSKADQRNNAWAELHLTAALQGLVNRTKPRLYVTFITSQDNAPGNIDKFWLGLMCNKHGWLADKTTEPIASIEDLVAAFRSSFKGVVLYDLNVPATSNVASTVSGCDDLLPIPYDTTPGSVYERLVAGGPQLPVKVRLVNEDGSSLFTGSQTGSAKCEAYIWAKQHYLDTGKCDPSVLAYYPDYWCLSGGLKHDIPPYEEYSLTNHDYFISRRAFFFDLSPWEDERPQDDPHQPTGDDYRTLTAILGSAYHRMESQAREQVAYTPSMIEVGGFIPWAWKYNNYANGSVHPPVATEWRFVAEISCYNGFLDGDALALNGMANASFFTHISLKNAYPQTLLTQQDWINSGYLTKDGKLLPWTFVTFYSGDYDSAAWLYHRLPAIWNDPKRGAIPIGWAFNPNLARRFPLGFDWVRQTATANDFFIAGDSGAGYLNPGYLDRNRPFSGIQASGLGVWERQCTDDYKKFDLSLTGFVIDGDAPPASAETMAAYARFSPDGIVGQKLPDAYGLIAKTTTPFIRMDATLPAQDKTGSPFNTVKAALDADRGKGPHFHVFRTILWSPSQYWSLYNRLDALDKVAIVDPYTFMSLLKMHLLQTKH